MGLQWRQEGGSLLGFDVIVTEVNPTEQPPPPLLLSFFLFLFLQKHLSLLTGFFMIDGVSLTVNE
jgi:hypothetical protein